MTTTTTTRTSTPTRADVAGRLTSRVLGAVLALAVAAVHVRDQGGFPGDKSPTYVGIGYYVLELAGVVAAVALLLGAGRHATRAWLLSLAVALAPILGFVLSRGPGLPSYADDEGNWTEPLGVVSLVVEGTLLVLAAVVLSRSRRVSR